MLIEYVPLLQTQRRLQGMPLNYDRFREYLRTIAPDRQMMELPPLGIMNPMGKEHVTALLDDLLAMDADRIASQAIAEVSPRVADVPGEYKFAVVIADDLKGGWTNRYDNEFKLRFGDRPQGPDGKRPRWLKDLWLTAILWSSEPASERAVREAVLTTLYRAGYVHRHGLARTLAEMMTQEGQVMAAAGCTTPMLDPDDIAYTREVLVPFLGTEDKRTAIECLFGDMAGRTLGFTPRGLSPWAGLALALHEAQATPLESRP
jgi:hypothetical protein